MALIGYARTSRRGSNINLQVSALIAAGCKPRDVYSDEAVSGVLARRPQWDRCLARLRRGDTLISTDLDRIGRSVKHLLAVSEDLTARGVDLVIPGTPIDTRSANGKMYFVMAATIAEFQRNLTVERTRAGLEAARAKGHTGGRPYSLTSEQRRLVRRLHSEGNNVAQVARMMGTSRGTVYRTLEAAQRLTSVQDGQHQASVVPI